MGQALNSQQEDGLEAPLYSDVAPRRNARPACRRLDSQFRARTVLNVWGDSSPVAPGAQFGVSVSAKCLDGFSAAGRAVVALDGDGAAAGVARLAPPAEEGGLSEARLLLCAPEKPGLYAWQVAIEADASHAGVVKPLFYSVAPLAQRPVVLRIKDAGSGVSLTDGAAYFYPEGVKGAPIVGECGEDGAIRALVARDIPYTVRIECARYHEACLKISAGQEPFEAQAAMESTLWDPVGLGGRGFDQF